MKITFNINYRTQWGEALYVVGDIPELGAGNDQAALQLNYLGGESWQITLEVSDLKKDFTYRYIVKAPGKAWRFEWGEPHRFEVVNGVRVYDIFDRWQDQPYDKPYYSSAFTQGMLNREHRDAQLPRRGGELNVRVQAPMIAPGQVLAISGECAALGEWNVEKALYLNDANYPEWEINLPLADIPFPCEYKFLIIDKATRQSV
ncbi:MAG: 4-alpha-glucanotransferase, partial [Muribaculaceae bacterium]|nr:4-alpha-glucanotransferase [Muribaculaceae bacterium]